MVLAIYLFLMIYAPKIGVWGEMISFVSILLIIRASTVGAIEPFAVRRLRSWLMMFFAVLFLYSLLIVVINPGFNTYYLLRFGRTSLQFLGSYALIRLYYRKYYDGMADKLLLHLYWAIAAHATIMLLMYFVPPLRFFILNILGVTMATKSGPAFFAGKRVGGLTVALDTLSFVQSVGVLLFPLVIGQLRGYKAILGSAALVIIGFSIFISGRTGTIILILFMPIVLLYARKRAVTLFLKLGAAALILAIAVALITPSAEVQTYLTGEKERLMTLLKPYEEGGTGLQTGAPGKLIDDYLHDWPTDLGVFLFGNSTSSRAEGSRYFVSADPGYILDTYGIGIVGLSLMLSFYIVCLWHARKCFPYHKSLALFSLLYAVQSLIVNGKVRFALAREGFTISVVLLVASVYLRSIASEFYEEEQTAQIDIIDEYADSLSYYADW